MPDPLPIAVGDHVRRTNQPGATGEVLEIRLNAQLGTLKARVRLGDGIRDLPVSELERVPSRIDMWDDLSRLRLGDASAFRTLMTYERLRRPPSAIRTAFGSARATLYPYQFKPLLKFLENPAHRLLVADDVGLGKTIEAGYVLREWRARQPVEHCLIVVPARLRTKWRDELKQKFEENFDVVGRREIRTHLQKARGGREVEPFAWIASYETLRAQEVIELFEDVQPPIDLAIFDEAHRLRNRGTLQHDLGHAVCQSADALLFLTATPIQTKLADLHTLLDLLEPKRFGSADAFEDLIDANRPVIRAVRSIGAGDFVQAAVDLRSLSGSALTRGIAATPEFRALVADLERLDPTVRADRVRLQREAGEYSLTGSLISRTRKTDVMKNWPTRQPWDLAVSLSEDERAVYDAALEISRLLYPSGDNFAQQMSASMAYRYTASCIPAAGSFFRERLLGLGAVDWQDEVGADAAADEELGELAPAADVERRMAELLRIVSSRAPRPESDTKLCRLLEALEGVWADDRDAGRAPRKILVFAYFKRTLSYLEQQLARRGIEHRLIRGDVPFDERETRIDEFLHSERINVLLSSEVGGEGLDLQRASVVVNYDLPWNPMVVEQRIGRVDRIGQQSPKILIVNFFTEETVEQRILQRLYERIGLFRQSIGELEPIVGRQINQLLLSDLRGDLAPAEAAQQAERTLEAILRNLEEAQRVGRASDALLAADQAFLDEIERMVSDRRVPAAEDLRALVDGFLANEHPGFQVEGDPVRDHGELRVPRDAAVAVRGWAARWGTEAYTFAGRLERGAVPITYDAEVAMRHRRLEFLQPRHPLVQFIAERMHARHSSHGRAFALRVSDPGLPQGAWLLAVKGIDFVATRAETRFEVGVLDLDGGRLLLGDEATPFLSSLLAVCETIDPLPDAPPQGFDSHVASLRRGLDEHIDRLEGDTLAAENRRIGVRRESWRVTLSRRVQAEQDRIDRLTESGAGALPIRLAQGRLEKRQKELNERMQALAAQGQLSWESYDIATALLLVAHDGVRP